MNKPRSAALALAAIAPLAVCDAAAAEPTARVEYSDAFTTRTPGAPSGRIFFDEFFDARDPNAKPPALQYVHLQLPEGARFDTDAVPHCGATDAELMARGPEACAPGSQVGTEVFSFDTGVEGHRLVTNDIAFLNDPGELIILTRERESGTRVVVRGKIGPETFDFELAPLPGTPPEGGADKREDASYGPTIGPEGRAWLTTPPTCPASGKWTFRTDFTFRNGEKVTKTSDSPCDRASTAAAPKVTFFRRQHGRTMRVRASDALDARLRIVREGRRVASRDVHLKAGVNRLRLPALPPGSYRLTLKPEGGVAREAALRISG
jgi:hypothetical protein